MYVFREFLVYTGITKIILKGNCKALQKVIQSHWTIKGLLNYSTSNKIESNLGNLQKLGWICFINVASLCNFLASGQGFTSSQFSAVCYLNIQIFLIQRFS